MELAISIWHRGSTSYLRCEGYLDRSSSPKLQDAIEMVLETRPRVLDLDCRKLAMLTASGVDALISAAAEGQARGIQVNVRLTPDTERIAEVLAGQDLEPWVHSERPSHASLGELVDQQSLPAIKARTVAGGSSSLPR